uniref:U3 small nucleolar RNA-associated protein 14 n=1 Tax=Picocystis salinarum TaxID=88271 RepID=A0A6U9R434_9CHLO|eukprot:CAMPEP_0183827822 /NCGR_PEP_ID=MMETSP0807_2-20130328/2450_1 /TAXON_ID=88271 /ORGANISM="Picocystis salinarum, Strain CCMP1897" /LENGTH=893 /DNA_ID=CAMNT_0026072995 /DNA_START=75 /DNA_END=2756 /DNA_ORIENTATION=+
MARERGIRKDNHDVYEAEEGTDAPEDRPGASRRHDRVPTLEYTLPDTYEDEEIDEEEAFDSEDEARWEGVRFGRSNSNRSKRKETHAAQVDTDTGSESEEEKEVYETDSEVEDVEDDDRYRKLLEDVKIGQGNKSKSARETLSEVYPESEFNLNPGTDQADGQQGVSIGDLLRGLGDSKGIAKVKKGLQKLETKAKPTEPPLPKGIREREQRKAGYEITKKDISKWKDLVKSNREKRTLVFAKPAEAMPKLTTAALAAKFQADNEMEKEVAGLLKEAKADTTQNVVEEEGLAMKSMTKAEMEERKDKLAKMRALMFYQEERSKRLKKIKSKEYHRRQNKTVEKVADRLAGLEDSDEDALQEEALKAEYARAEERLTLKHRNTSRWARRALKKGLHNSKPGVKEMLVEQMRIGEGLRQKILGKDGSGDSSGSESDEHAVEGEDVDGGNLKFKSETLKLLESGELDMPERGLFTLPFMKRAIEKKKREVEEEARNLLSQLDGEDAENGIASTPSDWDSAQVLEKQGGRRTYGREQKHNRGAGKEELEEDVYDEEEKERLENIQENLPASSGQDRPARRKEKATTAPELDYGAVLAKEKIRTPLAIQVPSSKKPPAKKTQGTTEEKSKKNGSKGNNKVENGKKKAKSKTKSAPSHSEKCDVQIAGLESKSQAAPTAPEPTVRKKSEAKSDAHEAAAAARREIDESRREKQAIANMSFVDEDVLEEFKNEKDDATGGELPQLQEFNIMPGWGAWSDQQRKPKWMIKAEEENKKKLEAAAAARKDANLPHVIISEKYDRKAAAHGSSTVPYPFTSKQAFEASIRMPIGKDFNTDLAFRNLSRPEVLTPGAGVIIEQLRHKEGKVPQKNVKGRKLNKRKLLEIAKATSVKNRPKHARLD